MQPRPIQFRPHTCPPRRGAIFIIALAVIVILSGLVLVFAQEMRTEALASANRTSYVQADAIEQGAEQWVLAQVESYAPDALTITETDAEALQVGDGYFFVLHPDPTQDQTYGFGITDEAGKININAATATTPLQFINLPGMTTDIVTAMGDWISPTGGTTASIYSSLQDPYNSKNGAFESVPEVLLLNEMTPQILYGIDLNHDGIIDANEQALAGVGAELNNNGTTTDTRGMYNYVTCFSKEPMSPPGGTARVNVNSPNALATLLRTALPSSANTIESDVRQAGNITSLSRFVTASRISLTNFGLIADQITAGAATGGAAAATTTKMLLNVNTASEQALMCLPTLVQADADAIIGARANADFSNMSWFFTALSTNAKMAAVADYVTDKSYQYSADIVAVSGDGRSFKRVFIVVDASNYPTTPAAIVYRKDLTELGWPLPPEYRTSLRAGQGVPTSVLNSNNSQVSMAK